jgi:hypothetical protein
MMNLDDSPYSPYDLQRLEMYDEIYEHESLYRDLDEPDDYYRNNHYYIGLSFHDKDYDNLLLASTIQNTTFFKYNLHDVVDYLNNYSVLYQNFVLQPQILHLTIDENTMYNVTVKTFWIKIIQRNWKRVVKKRKDIIEKSKGLLKYLNNRELGIKQTSLPCLRGMLNHLKA